LPRPRSLNALELARDEMWWLIEEVDRLTDENEELRVKLDDCREVPQQFE
jgi:hypothetical protein